MSETDDSWRSRVDRIKKILKLNPNIIPGYMSVANETAKLRSLFERFWLDEINAINIGCDGEGHNKLYNYINQ